MDKDLLQKLRKNPRITVVEESDATTVYLDGRLVLQTTSEGQVSAFQTYDNQSERLANTLLAGTRYTIAEGLLIEYSDTGDVQSIKTAMEVLLTWRKRRS